MTRTINRLRPGARLTLFSLAALGLAICAGWCLRAWILLRSDLIPGVNGAYYLIQARSILNQGSLGFPDFPLLFYLHAAFASLASKLSAEAQAITTVVRWSDILIPGLIAVPVFLFALAFPRPGKLAITPAAAIMLAGLVATTNPGLTRMVGDFQKNSAALPLSLTAMFFFYRSLRHHLSRDVIMAVLSLGLTCLTHVGVTALTLCVAGVMAFLSVLLHPDRKRALRVLFVLALTLCLALAAAALYDVERVARLLTSALEPGEVFSGSLFDSGASSGHRGGSFLVGMLPTVVGLGLGVLGVALVVFDRKLLRPAERTLLLSTSLTSLLFASPLIGTEWAQRLRLMAFAPGLIPLIYALVRFRFAWLPAAPLAVMVAIGGLYTGQGITPTITAEAYAELQGFKVSLTQGETLVVAEHGLEWWAAWTLETEVSNRLELAAEFWSDYEFVYVIERLTGRGINAPATVRGASPPSGPELLPSQRTPGDTPVLKEPVGGAPYRGDAETIMQGEYFRLVRLLQKPVILHGMGQPEIKGTLDGIAGQILVVEGIQVRVEEDTVLSQAGQVITINDLKAGEEVLVWGVKPLFQAELSAEYVVLAGKMPEPKSSLEPPAPPAPDPNPPMGSLETYKFGPVEIVTRAGWGARPPKKEATLERGTFDPEENPAGVLVYPEPLSEWLTTVVVHHSALLPSQGPRDIQQLHFNRGLTDIAYHFILAEDGTIYQGRPLNVRGAHVRAHNTGTVGIVLLGNMQLAPPSEAQVQALEALIHQIRAAYGITHIAGHRDFNPGETECPGDHLAELLPALAVALELSYGTDGYVEPPWSGDS